MREVRVASLEWYLSYIASVDEPTLGTVQKNSEFPIIMTWSCGADGYLLKAYSRRKLKMAIETVVVAGFYHSELVDDKLVRTMQAGGKLVVLRITEKETIFLAMLQPFVQEDC